MAMARLVGVNEPEDAYSAILEIGDQYCRPKDPLCDECPIKDYCISYMEGSFQSATPSGRMTAQNG
jgi:A/G-specific adenine glycosylase